jgi:hypothetical protein
MEGAHYGPVIILCIVGGLGRGALKTMTTHHDFEFDVRNFLLLWEPNGVPLLRGYSLMVFDDLLGISTIVDKLHDGFGRFAFVAFGKFNQGIVNPEDKRLNVED